MTEISKWTAERFTEFCVLCGTDYKEFDVHIHGFGIKTAFQYMFNFETIDDMLASMSRDTRWQTKMPCDVEEYMKRYRSVVAVFWHHTVFNPKRGMCVPICDAFPHGNRDLPGFDIISLCGAMPSKEMATRNAKGEIEPRTGQPRERVELTKMERSSLDLVLGRKRADQRQYQAEQQRKADAEAAHAAYLARDSPSALTPIHHSAKDTAEQAISGPSTNPKSACLSGNGDGNAAAAVAEVARPKPPREFFLLPSDIDAILSLRESPTISKSSDHASACADPASAADSKDGTHVHVQPAPTAPGTKFGSEQSTPPKAVAVTSSETPPPQRTNPFARKRAAGAGAPVLEKRPRLVAPVPAPLVPSPPASVPAPKTEEPQARKLAEVEGGQLGGYGRKHAVLAVLAQRGRPELVPLLECQDRSKISSFFTGNAKSKIVPMAKEPVVAVTSALERWRAHPWKNQEEEEEVNPFAVATNPLSLDSSRCSFRSVKGWR